MRTVRAVSSEDFERARYRETLNKGFAKGVKDAAIGSLATFFNSGLDLFAGVLVLWYGGSVPWSLQEKSASATDHLPALLQHDEQFIKA